MMWFEIKDWLELSTGLDRDSLHIYAGIGVQLFFALFFRRSLASPFPWLFTAAVAVANEIYDYSVVAESFQETPAFSEGAVRDIWNTMLLPSVFFVTARFRPKWLTGDPKTGGEAENLEGFKSPI